MKHTPSRWPRFLSAYALSIASDRWFDAAIPALSLLLLGDLHGVALHLMSFGCARLLVSLGAPRLIARRPSRPWLAIVNLATAAAMIGLGTVLMTQAPQSMLRLGIVLAGTVLGAAAGVEAVVFGATVKATVPPERMGSAQAHLEVADSVISLVAPLLATWLFLAWQPGPVLVAAGLVYVVVSALRWPCVIPAPGVRDHRLGILARLTIPFQEGERRHISIGVLTASLLAALSVPVAAERLGALGLSPALSGVVIAATSLGSIPAALLAGRVAHRLDGARLVLVWALAGASLFLLGLQFSVNLPLTLALAAGFDACVCWVFVVAGTARTKGEETVDLLGIASTMSVLGATVPVVAGGILLGFPFGRATVGVSALACVVACALSARPLTSLGGGRVAT